MKFGNWTVTEDSVDFNDGTTTYSIFPLTSLPHTPQGVRVFDWLHQLKDKKWMTEQDIKNLEEAFYYAAEQNNLTMPEELRINSRDMLNAEIEERKMR